MHPNLIEGDVVLVNRVAYDLKLPLTNIRLVHLGDPRRGDIITFWSPSDGRRLIKRVMALPGDTIAMHHKQLLINGQPAAYLPKGKMMETIAPAVQVPAVRLSENTGDSRHDIQWLEGATRAVDFGPIVIPAERYLMLGDNRDNSADSRYIGLIDRSLLIGKAERILVSDNYQGNWAPRFERFGKELY
jgi:signal peptidase I